MEVSPDDDTGSASQVFREPVITPSGLSYEQSALQEHLSKARLPSVHLLQLMSSSIRCIPLQALLMRMAADILGLIALVTFTKKRRVGTVREHGLPASIAVCYLCESGHVKDSAGGQF